MTEGDDGLAFRGVTDEDDGLAFLLTAPGTHRAKFTTMSSVGSPFVRSCGYQCLACPPPGTTESILCTWRGK